MNDLPLLEDENCQALTFTFYYLQPEHQQEKSRQISSCCHIFHGKSKNKNNLSFIMYTPTRVTHQFPVQVKKNRESLCHLIPFVRIFNCQIISAPRWISYAFENEAGKSIFHFSQSRAAETSCGVWIYEKLLDSKHYHSFMSFLHV